MMFLYAGGRFRFYNKGSTIFRIAPNVWMFDDDFKSIEYNYFNSGAIREIQEGTYTDGENGLLQEYVTWNHSLSEVINRRKWVIISRLDMFSCRDKRVGLQALLSCLFRHPYHRLPLILRMCVQNGCNAHFGVLFIALPLVFSPAITDCTPLVI